VTNPFTPTFGVTPPLLVGRGNVLDEFSLALDGGVGDPGRAMLLTGVRGAGKTVALNACEEPPLDVEQNPPLVGVVSDRFE